MRNMAYVFIFGNFEFSVTKDSMTFFLYKVFEYDVPFTILLLPW